MLKFNKILYWLVGMGATNLERTIIAVASLTGISILAILRIISSDVVTIIYSMIIGYAFGHSSGVKAEQLTHNKE